MGKRKLQRFKENLTFPNFIQPDYSNFKGTYPLKGRWSSEFFKNNNPVVLELGCGKGEYAVGLAELNPQINFIGIDIKGSRMWKGCKYSNMNNISNVAFLRTRIDFIEQFFDKEEISEIWLTFPDPQRKKYKNKKRLTSPLFLSRYSNILKKNHLIHLKTDSLPLFEYTLEVISENAHKLHYHTFDINEADTPEEVKSIKTFYEKKFLDQGLMIKYLRFSLMPDTRLQMQHSDVNP